MGAWDSTPFGNDAALDWLGEAADGELDAAVSAALRAVMTGSYLDADEGSAAVAAAALLAAALTGDTSALPEDAANLLPNWTPSASLRGVAAEALTAVLGPESELASLWGDSQDWRGSVERLRTRLAAAH